MIDVGQYTKRRDDTNTPIYIAIYNIHILLTNVIPSLSLSVRPHELAIRLERLRYFGCPDYIDCF